MTPVYARSASDPASSFVLLVPLLMTFVAQLRCSIVIYPPHAMLAHFAADFALAYVDVGVNVVDHGDSLSTAAREARASSHHAHWQVAPALSVAIAASWSARFSCTTATSCAIAEGGNFVGANLRASR